MVNSKRLLALVTLAGLTAGCIPAYTLVAPGANNIENLQVQASAGWNLAPNAITPAARHGSQTWTKDGPLLDRLVFIPAVPDGEPLLDVDRESAALPVFRKDMLPNELEELAESTFVKLFGEGNVAVNTENLRPQRFGEHRGVMFDMSATVTESPDYRGTVGAFIADDHLYMMYFFAAQPHYYGKHLTAAEAVITSATLAQ